MKYVFSLFTVFALSCNTVCIAADKNPQPKNLSLLTLPLDKNVMYLKTSLAHRWNCSWKLKIFLDAIFQKYTEIKQQEDNAQALAFYENAEVVQALFDAVRQLDTVMKIVPNDGNNLQIINLDEVVERFNKNFGSNQDAAS